MFLVLGLCLGLSSFALLGGAALAYFKQRRTMESRTATTGTVVELARTHGRRGYIYNPVVEFTPPSGQTIRFTSDFGSRPASHRVGQTVKVRYDPVDPQKAEVESTLSTWLLPGILIFMGTIACCLSVVFTMVYGLAQTTISP
jgi:hypothetical protein